MDHLILEEDKVPRNEVQFAPNSDTIPILLPDFLEEEQAHDTFVADALSDEPKVEEEGDSETKHQKCYCVVWDIIKSNTNTKAIIGKGNDKKCGSNYLL